MRFEILFVRSLYDGGILGKSWWNGTWWWEKIKTAVDE